MSDWVFPPPYRPDEKYRYELLSKPEGEQSGWPRNRVSVQRDDDGTWTEIAQYDRNYSMMRTFLPFRQLRDGVWKDYALISPRYVSFSVMDLQTGEIVAEQSPTPDQLERAEKHAAEMQAKYPDKGYTADRLLAGGGFCPVEFWMPDFATEWDERDQGTSLADQFAGLEKQRALPDRKPDEPLVKDNFKWWDASDEMLRGDWALYSGCVWGDDSSWKVQYIDLSRLSEGVVTGYDKFGYVELPSKIKLKDAVTYSGEADRLEIAVAVHFKRVTGEATSWSLDGIKKSKTEDDD